MTAAIAHTPAINRWPTQRQHNRDIHWPFTTFVAMRTLLYVLSCGTVLLATCSAPETPLPETLFEYLAPAQTGVTFINTIDERPGRNIGTYDYMYNGGGVAIADLNNDGLPDLIFTGNDTPSRIYKNLGNLRFEDVTEKSGFVVDGWATGVTVVDINNDGLLDLYICRSGPDYKTASTANLLFINKGKFAFEERAKEYGLANRGLSTQAIFFDYDDDGDLDLFVLNHGVRNLANLAPEWFEAVSRLPETEQRRFSNALYRNEGNGSFTEVSARAGINGVGFGLGVAVADFTGNGLPDIFIANDYFIPDRLYLNYGNGTFSESARRKFRHTSFFSMGCDAADFNNDGLIDLVVPDMSPDDHYRSKLLMAGMDTAQFGYLDRLGFTPQYMFNALYLNNGNGVMSDIAHLAGVARTDWSWAPLLADLDNDGLKDLIITNGILRETTNNDWRLSLFERMKAGQLDDQSYFDLLQQAPSNPTVNAAFRNMNGLEFTDHTPQWGLTQPSFSHGMAVGDLDGDGDLDMVVNNLNSEAFIIRNTAAERGAGYIRIKIEAPSGEIPVQGALLTLHYGGATQLTENRFTRGFQSFCEPIVHFGLGHDAPARVDSVVVIWPNGRRSVHADLETNTVHHIAYDGKVVKPVLRVELLKPWWDISDLAIRPPAVHNENAFDDFRIEQLLPHRMSTLGPALAVGDVNGDGLDDFYLGGAKGEPGMLYLQTAGGFFERSSTPVFNAPALREGEDLGALLFDADGDGDLDLYIARGGGGDVEAQPVLLNDVLLLNDGQGNFTLSPSALPKITASTMAVEAFDIDGDGDLDLFIGGRNLPGQYPFGTRSYLLENRNGRFVDVTETHAPALLEPRMVTDATWVTSGIDAKPNLVVVGEWMAPEIFTLDAGVPSGKPWLMKADHTGFDSLHGWWFSVSAIDIEDGTLLVLGNLGHNNKFHPSVEKPLFVFAGDFDDNGTLDIVLSKQYRDRLVPVRGRACSSSQMPVIRERFPTYHAFAEAPLEQILGIDDLSAAFSLRAETFTSGTMVLRNTGMGPFVPLPVEAQIAPVFGAVQVEPNALIIAGNLFTTEVETTPYDAGKGLLLHFSVAGDRAVFSPVSGTKSGVFLPGDVRKLSFIKVSSDGIPGVIAASNGRRIRVLMKGDG